MELKPEEIKKAVDKYLKTTYYDHMAMLDETWRNHPIDQKFDLPKND